MSYDNCLGCGVLLSPNVYECPICLYDNSFGHYHDIPIDDEFLMEFNEIFEPDDNAGY